jgi:hypothetical protein
VSGRTTRVVQALSGDHALLGAFERSPVRGRVHTVFRRVVNLDVGGGLCTIAGRGLDNGPATLVCDTAGFADTGVHAGDPVAVVGGNLLVGERFAVRLVGARPWHARLPAYPADAARLRDNLDLAREQIASARVRCDADDDALGAMTAVTIDRRVAALRDALRRGDRSAACEHGRSLVGLGRGLTPTGDDVLVGLFAVLHVPGGPLHRFAGLCSDIVADAQLRTNAVSIAALEAAARGRVRESIHALLHSLMGGSRTAVRAALAAVLAIGATSGNDIASGVVAGFDAGVSSDCAA